MRLHDAQTLLMFLYGMVGAGRSGLTPRQLGSWRERLRQRLSELIADNSGPTRRVYYLYMLGALGLHPDPSANFRAARSPLFVG